MTNVRDVFRRPGDSEPVAGVWVQVDLVPPGGTLPAEEATIFTTSRIETDSGGAWQLDLPPTVNGDSAYTTGPYVYLVSASYSGQNLAYHIDVPTSLETVWAQDIRTDPPDPEVPPDPTPGDGSFVATIDGNDYDVTTVEFTADVDAQIVAAETLELGVADTIARTAQLTAHEADQTTHGVDFTQLVDIVALGAAVAEARTIDAQLYEDGTGNLTTSVVDVQLLADAVHDLNIGEGGGPGAVDDLNDLDDVNLTGLVTGQGLTYNGALFVPTDLTTQTDFTAHLADSSAAHVASAISFIPDGSISATDVQSAIQEVRDEATGGGGGPLPDVVDELQIVSDVAEAFTTAALVTVHDDGTVSGQFASPFMLEEFLLATDAGEGLDAIGAASAVHTHDAEDLTGFQTLIDSSSIHFTDAGTDTSAAVVAIAGEVISSGTVADARIASTIARDSEVAALSSVYQPLDSDLTAIAGLTTTSFGRSLLTQTDASTLRTAAGTVIGTNVQAYDADLAAIAALTTTTFGRSLLTQADAEATRDTLELLSFVEGNWVDIVEDVPGGTITVNVDLSEGKSGGTLFYGSPNAGEAATFKSNSADNVGVFLFDVGAFSVTGATALINTLLGFTVTGGGTRLVNTAGTGAGGGVALNQVWEATGDDVEMSVMGGTVATTTATVTNVMTWAAASFPNDTVYTLDATVVASRPAAHPGRPVTAPRSIGGRRSAISAGPSLRSVRQPTEGHTKTMPDGMSPTTSPRTTSVSGSPARRVRTSGGTRPSSTGRPVPSRWAATSTAGTPSATTGTVPSSCSATATRSRTMSRPAGSNICATASRGGGRAGLGFRSVVRAGEWSSAGTWTRHTTANAYDKGPSRWGYRATTSTAIFTYTKPAGATIAAGTRIVYVDGSGSGNWSYRIDGGTWTASGAATAGDNGVKAVTLTSPVTSTLDVRGANAAGTNVQVDLLGVDVRNGASNGLLIHNVAVSAHRLTGTPGVYDPLVRTTAGDGLAILDFLDPDLTVVAFVNDATDNTPSVLRAGIQTVVDRTVTNGGLLVFVRYPEVVNSQILTTSQDAARAAFDAEAAENSIDTVDVFTAFGAFAVADAAGYFQADDLHISTSGHQLWGETVWRTFAQTGKAWVRA